MKKKRDIRELVRELYDDAADEMMLMDGLDDAFIGVITKAGHTIALYDEKLIIKILMKRDKMTEEDAWDFYQYNIKYTYVGDYTPAILEERF